MRLYGDADLCGDRNAVDLAENVDAADVDGDTRVGRLAIVARWMWSTACHRKGCTCA